MRILTYKRLRVSLIIGLLIMFPFTLSCSGSEYTTRYFSFPPGTKPHENEWQFMTLVIVSSNQKPIAKKSRKKVKIRIYDKNKTDLLNEDFEFVSASIDAKVVWNTFKEISVELVEVGNKFADDPYNEQLLKAGPNSLLKLTYKYAQNDRKFFRNQPRGVSPGRAKGDVVD